MTMQPTDTLPAPSSDSIAAVQRLLLRELLEFTRIAGNVAWLLEEEARRQQQEDIPHV